MTRHWVNAAEMTLRLRTEATSTATRLGHRMSAWVATPGEPGRGVSRCVDCDDLAQVSVRDPHRASITGAAVELRCVPALPPRSAKVGPSS